jgi:putative phage-type endonuclease
MIQGTDEWFKARLGKVTASKVSDIMTKTKSGYGASRKNYMGQLLCERLTGKREESYTNAAMMRGTELEPKARAFYEVSNSDVIECGLIDHPAIKMFAASPDGLVGDEGLIEIKCPNTMTHVDFLLSKKPDSKYITQMQVQMACTGRKWCDFVSFDDRLPVEMQFSTVRIMRDDAYISEVEAEVKLFLEELDNLVIKLKEVN